jgi:hypothetical protein
VLPVVLVAVGIIVLPVVLVAVGIVFGVAVVPVVLVAVGIIVAPLVLVAVGIAVVTRCPIARTAAPPCRSRPGAWVAVSLSW